MLTQSASTSRKPSEGITLWSLGKDVGKGGGRNRCFKVTLNYKTTELGLYPLHPHPTQASVFFQFLINKALGDQSSHKTFHPPPVFWLFFFFAFLTQ